MMVEHITSDGGPRHVSANPDVCGNEKLGHAFLGRRSVWLAGYRKSQPTATVDRVSSWAPPSGHSLVPVGKSECRYPHIPPSTFAAELQFDGAMSTSTALSKDGGRDTKPGYTNPSVNPTISAWNTRQSVVSPSPSPAVILSSGAVSQAARKAPGGQERCNRLRFPFPSLVVSLGSSVTGHCSSWSRLPSDPPSHIIPRISHHPTPTLAR